MIYSKKILKPLLMVCAITSIITNHSISLCNQPAITNKPLRLSALNYKSASVLPFYHYKNTKYVILSREGFGKDKGTWDDFGGGRDKEEKRLIKNRKQKNHPVITAAREFYEEAILQTTVNLDPKQTRDLLNKQSEYIISYSYKNGCDQKQRGSCNVTYITNFNQYADQFFKNFYTARENAREFKYKEKDKIAIVAWHNLKNAIVAYEKQKNSFLRRWFGSLLSPLSRTIMVPAMELQKDASFKPTVITLRPFLVKKLRPFFLDQPYQQGMNKTIRHYRESL